VDAGGLDPLVVRDQQPPGNRSPASSPTRVPRSKIAWSASSRSGPSSEPCSPRPLRLRRRSTCRSGVGRPRWEGPASRRGNDSAMPYLNPAGEAGLPGDVLAVSATVYSYDTLDQAPVVGSWLTGYIDAPCNNDRKRVRDIGLRPGAFDVETNAGLPRWFPERLASESATLTQRAYGAHVDPLDERSLRLVSPGDDGALDPASPRAPRSWGRTRAAAAPSPQGTAHDEEHPAEQSSATDSTKPHQRGDCLLT
jgi:hypothetical protein